MRSRQIMAIRINCCSISKLHVYTYIFISLLWQWALPQTWSITVKSNEFFVHTNARYFPHLMLFFFSNIDCNRTSCDLVITAYGHNWFFCKWFIWFGVCNWVFMLITISDDVKLLKSNEFTDLKNEKKRIYASRGNCKKKIPNTGYWSQGYDFRFMISECMISINLCSLTKHFHNLASTPWGWPFPSRWPSYTCAVFVSFRSFAYQKPWSITYKQVKYLSFAILDRPVRENKLHSVVPCFDDLKIKRLTFRPSSNAAAKLQSIIFIRDFDCFYCWLCWCCCCCCRSFVVLSTEFIGIIIVSPLCIQG